MFYFYFITSRKFVFINKENAGVFKIFLSDKHRYPKYFFKFFPHIELVNLKWIWGIFF